MATLNVKNLSDELYRRLCLQAQRHRRSAAQEVTRILEDALSEPEPLSLIELRGLGKSAWQAVDAASHVERERQAWD